MKVNKLFPFAIGAVILIIIIYSFSGNKEVVFDLSEYTSNVLQERARKDSFLKNDKSSPLPAEVKSAFKSIDYFPINENLRIIADFQPIPAGNIRKLQMTGGEMEKYTEYGYVRFELASQPQQLLILKSMDQEQEILFLPFFDKTNGISTYGGGRYLDPEALSNGKILLDFNRAYNPYCAYSAEYTCPIPPLQNRLEVAVQAGERDFPLK